MYTSDESGAARGEEYEGRAHTYACAGIWLVVPVGVGGGGKGCRTARDVISFYYYSIKCVSINYFSPKEK